MAILQAITAATLVSVAIAQNYPPVVCYDGMGIATPEQGFCCPGRFFDAKGQVVTDTDIPDGTGISCCVTTTDGRTCIGTLVAINDPNYSSKVRVAETATTALSSVPSTSASAPNSNTAGTLSTQTSSSAAASSSASSASASSSPTAAASTTTKSSSSASASSSGASKTSSSSAASSSASAGTGARVTAVPMIGGLLAAGYFVAAAL